MQGVDLMLELEGGGYRNSVVKRRNTDEFVIE